MRVFWKQEELEALANRLIADGRKSDDRGLCTAVDKVQRYTLPQDRWRSLTTNTHILMLRKVMAELEQRVYDGWNEAPAELAAHPLHPEQERPATTLQAPATQPVTISLTGVTGHGQAMREAKHQLAIKPQVTIEVLIENIADVVLQAVAARVNERLIEALAENIDIDELTERLLQPRSRKPKVLIAGLLPGQREMIKQEFGTEFALDFYMTDDNLKRLRPKLQSTDHFVTFTSKIEHATEGIAKSMGVPIIRCSGGMTMLRDTLTQLYLEKETT